MTQLHLPAQHSDNDLALAGALATLLESDRLYVAYSLEAGPAEPVIPAALHAHEPERADDELPAPRHPRRRALRTALRALFGLPPLAD